MSRTTLCTTKTKSYADKDKQYLISSYLSDNIYFGHTHAYIRYKAIYNILNPYTQIPNPLLTGTGILHAHVQNSETQTAITADGPTLDFITEVIKITNRLNNKIKAKILVDLGKDNSTSVYCVFTQRSRKKKKKVKWLLLNRIIKKNEEASWANLIEKRSWIVVTKLAIQKFLIFNSHWLARNDR